MSILASTIIRDQTPALAEEVVENIYRRQRERWGSFGEEGRHKSVRDTGYHLRYLAEALAADDPALYTEYLAWVKVLFAGLNFSPSVLPDTLSEIYAVIEKSVPDSVRSEILAVLESGQKSVDSPVGPRFPPGAAQQQSPSGQRDDPGGCQGRCQRKGYLCAGI